MPVPSHLEPPIWQEATVIYRHFKRFLRENPDVASWIRYHFGTPYMRHAFEVSDEQRRDYIENVLKFVAFRDFSSLNLTATDESYAEPADCGGKVLSLRTDVKYIVRFRLGGSDLCKWHSELFDYDKAPCSIQKKMQDMVEWYETSCGAKIHFGYVVKVSRTYDERHERYVSETVELFPFPSGFKVEAAQAEAA